MSQTPILSTKSGHLPLTVVFAGKDFSSPAISQVRLGNTGKIELKSDDFDGPVRIGFNSSDILQIRISGRSSDAINPSVSKDTPKSICFTPTLLNPGEWIEYQLIKDGALEAPTVHARVAGHGSASIDSLAQRRKRLETTGLIMLFGGMVLVLITFWLGQEIRSWLTPICWGIVIVGGITTNRASASVWTKLPKAKKAKRAKN